MRRTLARRLRARARARARLSSLVDRRARLLAALGALSASLHAQSDGWAPPIQLRMANPYFPTNSPVTDDFFAPIHATLGPGGHIMLFGYRQSDLEISGAAFLAHRTGSMAAILNKGDINNPPSSGYVTLQSLGEKRDLSCGFRIATAAPATPPPNPNAAEFVESDPGDLVKELFVDRVFCSGHVPLADGSVFAVGGLRAAIRWDQWQGILTQMPPNASFGGGLPYVQRWDWALENASWMRLPTLMAGLGDKFVNPLLPTNSTNWLPASPCAAPPSGIIGIFMGNERYYATATLMLDGRVLITGGSWFLGVEQGTPITPRSFLPPDKSRNLSVEIYKPIDDTGSGSTTVLSNSTIPPATAPQGLPMTPAEVFNPDYTHVFVLPTLVGSGGVYDVLMLGEAGKPLGFSTSTPAWFASWPTRPNSPACPNDGASTVLLPLRLANPAGINDFGYHNGAVLCAGGYDNSSPTPQPRRQIDIFDPLSGVWTSKDAMMPTMPALLTVGRHELSTVLLPDGRIAVIGGHNGGQTELKKAEYITLNANGTLAVALGQNEMSRFRAYHAVALLRPDGRIFVGGGRLGGVFMNPFEQADYTILSPSYVSVPRPTITFVQNKVLHRQNDPTNPVNPVLTTTVNVDMTDAGTAPIEAVLVSLGSMTHSFDMNQRHVQVAITNIGLSPPPSTSVSLTVTAPDYRWAPPGYYMLFLLGPGRIPSKAAMIQLR